MCLLSAVLAPIGNVILRCIRTWSGLAAELAERGDIAVYPVLGWWKERANLERWGKSARYALIVSIKTPSVGMDIYTPIENQISVLVEI